LKGGRRLRPGRYTVSVVASDAAKLSSRAFTRKLTIPRRGHLSARVRDRFDVDVGRVGQARRW
jgi:hypothetical protein